MTRIQLVHFRGCPHVDSARENLPRAIATSGRHLSWTELDLDSGEVPTHARDLPSPTILVDGRDVSGISLETRGRSCRMGGAPSPDTILAALKAGD